jgi:hypothetical protein
MKKDFLDSIDVKSPCSESWDEMTGNDRLRFCARCATSIHNISAMTPAEAEKLIKKSEGKLCIRIEKSPDGKSITAPPKSFKVRRRSAAAAGILATSLTLSTLAPAQQSPVLPKDNPNQTQKDKQNFLVLSGVVTDKAGAVVPGAQVTLRNTKNGETRSTVSNTEGFYEFKNIEPAVYEITVEAAGFRTLTLKGVEILNNSSLRQTLSLQNIAVVGLFSTEQTVEEPEGKPTTTVEPRPLLELPRNPHRILLGLIVPVPKENKTKKKN